MTTADLAAALLRDVRRYMKIGEEIFEDDDGAWLLQDEVLAALTAAMDPALSERAGEVVQRLQAEKSVVSTTRTFPSGDERDMVLVPHYGPNPLANDAADLITALLAQNAALRAEHDRAWREADAWAGKHAWAVRDKEAAEAVAEKLRGALQIAKSIFDTPIGLRRLGIDPNTDERLIEFRALTTEADNE